MCGNRGAHWRFRRGCGGSGISSELLLGSNSEAQSGTVEGEKERGACEWSTTGRWTRRACSWRGQCSWSGGRLWKHVEDEEKDAIDAAHEVVEGDEVDALELENAEAMLEGLCIEARWCS